MKALFRVLATVTLLLALLTVFIAFTTDPWTPPLDESTIRQQLQRYPGMEASDLYKLVLQAASGPGHLGADPDHILHWLTVEEAEIDSAATEDTLLWEPIGGGYARIHIAAWRESGRTLEELSTLVVASAMPYDTSAVRDLWYTTLRSFACGRLAGPATRDLAVITRTARGLGWPPVHHSALYISRWNPHYRVVSLRLLDKLLKNAKRSTGVSGSLHPANM